MDGHVPTWNAWNEVTQRKLTLPTTVLWVQERSLVLRQRSGREYVTLAVPLDSVRHAEVEGTARGPVVFIRFDLTEAVTDGQVDPQSFPQSHLSLRLPMYQKQVDEADEFLRYMIGYIHWNGPFMPSARARMDRQPQPTMGPGPSGVHGETRPPRGGEASPTPDSVSPPSVPAARDHVATQPAEPALGGSEAAATSPPQAEPEASPWRPSVRISRVQDAAGLTLFADLPELDEFMDRV